MFYKRRIIYPIDKKAAHERAASLVSSARFHLQQQRYQGVTVKAVKLPTFPPGLLTLNIPVVAPGGTMAVI